MSTKLRNRRAVENKLGVFLEQLVVSEDLISSVLDTEVRIIHGQPQQQHQQLAQPSVQTQSRWLIN